MKIVITTTGGVIGSVYCSEPIDEVIIIDGDDLTDEEFDYLVIEATPEGMEVVY